MGFPPRLLKKGDHAMTFSQISRRMLIGAIAAGTMPAWAATKVKPRALALIGDRYHNPDYIHVSLDRVFHELDLPIDYTMDTAGLSAASLKPYQLLLILRDGMIWPGGYSGPDAYTAYEMDLEDADKFPAAKSVSWMTEEQGLAVKAFVEPAAAFIPCTIPATSRCRRKLSRGDGRRLFRPSAAAPVPGACHRERPSHHGGHEALHRQ